MNKGVRTRKINIIKNQVIDDMKTLGLYKSEFNIVINRYAEMKFQYEVLNEQWIADGCFITEEFTNKSGITNIRKTAQYLSLEMLRKELFEIENALGITPKGYKAIKSGVSTGKKQSKLASALAKLDG